MSGNRSRFLADATRAKLKGGAMRLIAITNFLVVMPAPEDVDAVLAAGVPFARALTGAEPTILMMALGEQRAPIRRGPRGGPSRTKKAVAEALEHFSFAWAHFKCCSLLL